MAESDPFDVTKRLPGTTPDGDRDVEPRTEIGRYRVEKLLGRGGFGLVYLARDDKLDRLVAIKVPHAKHITQPEDAESYIAEARTVANLDHPNIVPVHDVGSTDDCPCYVVSKYIEGTDLATKIRASRLEYVDAVELVATIADALHHAHKQGIVHRDVKPGNILIANDGKPYVVDFGLALREENIGKGPRWAGTPAYMSPEQARSEGHRVDGRSDIFSLGVMFYELLTGRRPFKGDTQNELLEQVTSYEPRPLRQYNEQLPKELERICHKAMAKRASDRFSSAHDFSNDLRRFLAARHSIPGVPAPVGADSTNAETQASTTGSTAAGSSMHSATSTGAGASTEGPAIQIVPKGLRSFDAHDADFYLELLPGPRDRDGLPESLRFWKARVEETDPDKTFPVGLLYGPSGCGKSSLVKAGLLPRLSEDVAPVYIEATPEETEARLLRGLRRRCPELQGQLTLKDTLIALRRGQGVPAGKKVLIILDQFEQWLHSRNEEEQPALVQALRQCDGSRIQCIVMVRDDFWMAVTRFLSHLEVDLVQGDNFAPFDLFPIRHAQKVLAAFGRAFGALPEDAKDTSKSHREFLKLATEGLAQEGKIICVRLSLFAEMMKDKPWTPASLRNVGGTKGVGATFLEETFNAKTNPKHRLHQQAARAVLKYLLPETGANIKGQMKSSDELLDASGYANRPQDFDALIDILDREIRFITPTDPEGADAEEADPDREDPEREDHAGADSRGQAGRKYYQLTHDYLVPSLREWLTRKQKETRRGRASLRLADRAVLWNSKPENQYLPPWWEYLNIRLLTQNKLWTESQRKMMRQAGRIHGLRFGFIALMLVVAGFAGVSLRDSVLESQNVTRSEGLVNSLLNAKTTQVPQIVAEIDELRPWANSLLESEFESAADGSSEKLHVALALLPVEPSQSAYLAERLPSCSLAQFPVLRDALRPHKGNIADGYWRLAMDERREAFERLHTAAALADYDGNAEQWRELAPFVAEHLTGSLSPMYRTPWLEFFRPASHQLTTSLTDIYSDRERSVAQREAAAFLLADYIKDQPDQLVPLILMADEYVEFSILSESLRPHFPTVQDQLMSTMKPRPPQDLSFSERNQYWKRQSLAAATLLQLGTGRGVWPMLTFTRDPSRRSFIIHHLGKLQVDHSKISARLSTEAEVSVRRALIQSLGGQRPELIAGPKRTEIVARLGEIYVNDPDPGIHAAAAWALKKWEAPVPQIGANVETASLGAWSWHVNSQGMTMVVIPPPGHVDGDQVERNLAVCSYEVTAAQFNRFREHEVIKAIAPTDDCPVHHVTWYMAAEYCNWLSERDGILDDQWAYEPNANGEYADGMKIKENASQLRGYRLPTATEWEHACRLGTQRAYSFGAPPALLGSYAHYVLNSFGRSHRVGSLLPNDAGLFDMHGNVWEWTQDSVSGSPSPVNNSRPRVMRGGSFLGLTQSVLSTNQTASRPDNHVGAVGFRPVRTCFPSATD